MEKNRTTFNAIAALTNNAEWSWIGEDYADIEWITKGVSAPTESEIKAKIAEIEATDASDKKAVEDKLATLGLSVADLQKIL